MMGRGMVPLMIMVIVQFGFAGMNIISKLAMDSGMNPLVSVAYRQIFASIIIAPFAYFLERGSRPRMTLPIFLQIFVSSIMGVTLNQITYFVGLKNSTPTIACALSNLVPAFTFVLAIPFKLETVGMRSKAGQAKLIGTTLCVGGAMLLSFYHGSIVPVGQSEIHWNYADKLGNENQNAGGNIILGPLLLIISSVSWAIWFILQARMSCSYPAPYSSSALMLIMASFQCVIVGVIVDHDVSSWSLFPGIRAVSAVYSGTVCSALAFCLMSWCIERRGPLYVSVFSPLLLVIVAFLSWGLLREKLYVGTVVGSVLIVMGLYGVLWGKNMEMRPAAGDDENVIKEEQAKEEKQKLPIKVDLELPSQQNFDPAKQNTK